MSKYKTIKINTKEYVKHVVIEHKQKNKLKSTKQLKTNKQLKQTKSLKKPIQPKKPEFWKDQEVEECVDEILMNFTNNVNELQIIADTQSGKSDIMINLVDKVYKNKRFYRKEFNFDKIAIIICASDLDLKRDLQTKITDVFKDDINIMIKHLPEISNYEKYKTDWENYKDCSIIIFDENHCDINEKSIVDNFRSRMKIHTDDLSDNDNAVRVIGFSATPYEQMHAMINYIYMKPRRNYYSIRDMLDNKKIQQSSRLDVYTNVKKVFDLTRIKTKIGYVIIRLPTSDKEKNNVMVNVATYFRNNNKKIITFMYNMNAKEDINKTHLNKKPKLLTIIYVKDKIRKGKTLMKNHIIMMYDRTENENVSTTVQSFAGRATGYNVNKNLIVFCHLSNIRSHLDWTENNFDLEYIPRTVHIRKNTLVNTFIGKDIEDIENNEDEEGNENEEN